MTKIRYNSGAANGGTPKKEVPDAARMRLMQYACGAGAARLGAVCAA